jgi:xylose isomerase
MDALRAANDRVNELDHARIIEATMKPGDNRGWIEAYLIRARAPQTSNLPSIDDAMTSISD